MADRPGPLTLTDPGADVQATFAPAAGMACTSLRHAGEELLAVDGIPFLHPWANRLEGWSYTALGREVDLRAAAADVPVDEHGLPIHGVRPRAWRVVERDSAGLSAELDFPADAAFPFAHRVRMDADLGEGRLRVRTTVTAAEPVPVAFGFHPYFRLPGVPREQWWIELPVRCHLVTDAQLIPAGEPEVVEPYAGPLGDRSYDDGFDHLADPAVFAVEGGGRRIAVTFEDGYGVAQVFAPARSSARSR